MISLGNKGAIGIKTNPWCDATIFSLNQGTLNGRKIKNMEKAALVGAAVMPLQICIAAIVAGAYGLPKEPLKSLGVAFLIGAGMGIGANVIFKKLEERSLPFENKSKINLIKAGSALPMLILATTLPYVFCDKYNKLELYNYSSSAFFHPFHVNSFFTMIAEGLCVGTILSVGGITTAWAANS